MYKTVFKRFIDFIAAFLLIILLSPIIVITALLLIVFNSGHVIFSQPRPGLNQQIFTLYKFKTMNDKKDVDGALLPDEERLTLVGKWVRKLSFDELPQLLNVLKGDMSLIGPRPWLIEYLPLYNEYQRRRHEVLPGITGWAQVNGRNKMDWNKRFEYDIYYVDHMSFWMDVKIVFMTIWNVVSSKGVSGEDTVTMVKFKGDG